MSALFQWWNIVYTNLTQLGEVERGLVQFKQEHFIWRAALMLLAALFLAVFWRYWRWRSWYLRSGGYLEESGFPISQLDKPGWSYRLVAFLPVALALTGIIFLLMAMADPYTVNFHQSRVQQSREIGYLRDVSASMGFRYKNTQSTRAEIVQDFILELISSRREKKDRSFYSYFASWSYVGSGFTTDNESLLFSVVMAPLAIVDPRVMQENDVFRNKFILKDYGSLEFGGGTDLAAGLATVIQVFDEKGDKKIAERAKTSPDLKWRSVVIITDGASQTDAEPELRGLRQRGIVPYLIFIDPDREVAMTIDGERGQTMINNADALLRLIPQYGGESFLATDEHSLAQVRQRLDQLYAAVTEAKAYTVEQHIFRLPLTVALILLALSVVMRAILFKFFLVV